LRTRTGGDVLVHRKSCGGFVFIFFEMKSTVQKIKPKAEEKSSGGKEAETVASGPRDFVSLSKEIGYIRARQLLKQVSVKRHQEKIDSVDAKKMHEYRPARFKAAVHQSMTYGAPTIETEIVCRSLLLLQILHLRQQLISLCLSLVVFRRR
jgi:hypothetical protein